MKRLLLFAFIAFCTASAANAQDIVNLRMDRQQMGLRGLVASMDEDIMLRKDYFREDWPERKWFVKDLRNILREDDGRIVTFNQAGRMTSITYTHQGKAGKKTECSYASNGLLSSFLGEGYKVEAKYNGSMADINVFAETKDYKALNLAKADLNTTPYSNSYPFDLKCRQELTDDGLVLKSSYYFVDSIPAKVCEYNYNHLNQLTSERAIDFTSGDKEVSTVRYTYDNRGFLVKKVVHSKALDETTTYENNELGDCTKMTVERPYGTMVYTFDYEYDTMDNWVVRLQFEDGIFDNAALRTLTYHKAAKEAKQKEKKEKAVKEKPDKEAVAAEKQADKERAAADKQAEKERKAAEKQAEKEAKARAKEDQKAQQARDKETKARQREEMKAQQERAKEAEKNMSKEERKALQERRKAEERAAKEQAKLRKQAEKERAAAEKRAEKERKAVEKQAEKERKAAEKQAEKERKTAEKQAEKERKAAEKAAKKNQ